MSRQKKAPVLAGAGADNDVGDVAIYLHNTRSCPTCQKLHRALDEEIAGEDYHTEIGNALLAEAKLLARAGFRHMDAAKSARRRRATLERGIPL